MTPSVPVGTPLALGGKTPLAYPTLGAVFHLEALEAEDQERLERVNDLVWDWLGGELRWCALSCDQGDEPIRRSHLDYISNYPPAVTDAAAEADPATLQRVEVCQGDYSVYCNAGGERRTSEASPYMYEFWAELVYDDADPDTAAAHSVVAVSVPEAWPLEDFSNRVQAIAAELRLRWGAAGYTYASSESIMPEAGGTACYAHARRHVGYDMGQFVRCLDFFYRRVRTVNWLTFIGPELLSELAEKHGAPLSSAGSVDVRQVGTSVLLQAGPCPERGDVNRLQIPVAYQQADGMIRPIRASDPTNLVFLGPWNDASIEQWFRRFETTPV